MRKVEQCPERRYWRRLLHQDEIGITFEVLLGDTETPLGSMPTFIEEPPIMGRYPAAIKLRKENNPQNI